MVISICLQLLGAKTPDRHQGSAPGPSWGTSVPSPRFVPPPETNFWLRPCRLDPNKRLNVEGPCTCYSVTHTQSQQRFTISVVAADCHELWIPRRIMRSSRNTPRPSRRSSNTDQHQLFISCDFIVHAKVREFLYCPVPPPQKKS